MMTAAWTVRTYSFCSPTGVRCTFRSAVLLRAAGRSAEEHYEEQFSIGLKSDGSVVAWGDARWWTIPEPNGGFVEVAASYSHALGLKADGSIVAWGADWSGQTNVPSPNEGFVAIAAGEYHSLGLKSNGSIVAWGYNRQGQTDVPEPNNNFVAVFAGSSGSPASFAIRAALPTPLPGDLDGDGVVGVADLLTLLGAWGPCADPQNCPADLDGDGVVGVADLLILLANWG
jgi:hypothetical protein